MQGIAVNSLGHTHPKLVKTVKDQSKNVEWSSTETALEPGQRKSDFDKDPVLDRMEIQLKKSGIETEFTKNIDLSWAVENTSHLVKK